MERPAGKAWSEHVRIADAIIRGDAPAARKATLTHNSGARANYLKMKAEHLT